MQSIDVVAITELLGVAAPLMERKLGLVPNSLVIPHGNANEEKPDVSQKTRDALAQLPAVQYCTAREGTVRRGTVPVPLRTACGRAACIPAM